MSILIQAQQISHGYSSRPLFKDLSLAIAEQERIGLIGHNGSGKSTLLQILARHIQPDEGTIMANKGLVIGYLEQVPSFLPGASVESTILQDIHQDQRDDWQTMAAFYELLSKLELEDRVKPDTLVEHLSGGLKKRIALARELIKKPALLMLDEPTNHLDIESILWLEEIIVNAEFATLVVTHDRLFLNRVANRMIELDRRYPQGLMNVKGDYEAYLTHKLAYMDTQKLQEAKLKNKMTQEMQWLSRQPKARTTKQTARIDRAHDIQKEHQELALRNKQQRVEFSFQSTEKTRKRLIETELISKHYGQRPLFSKLSLSILKDTRLGILGKNGCGKSTLIRILLGLEQPDSGQVVRADDFKVAYFEQMRDTLDLKHTVRHNICPRGDFVEFQGQMIHVQSYLDRFLFDSYKAQMTVEKLSGGEQSRLRLAQLMLKPASLLILDEPTNDLDIETLDLLQTCIQQFDGAVITVSHDRYFLEQVSNHVLAFNRYFDENLFKSNGGFEIFSSIAQWEPWYQQQNSKDQITSQSIEPASTASSASPTLSKNKLSFKEQKEYESMEQTIATQEQAIQTTEKKLQEANQTNNAVKINEYYQTLQEQQSQLQKLYDRWNTLENKIG